jgi:type IV pilus assembly protein PilN
MIRINLAGAERQKARKALAFSFDVEKRVTLGCAAILVATAVGLGNWYWSLRQESQQLDATLVAAQQEAARLQSVLAEVQEFEARRAQLQQRVSLIEQLRSSQQVPVQLLDHVSRSLPDMLWLTRLDQDGDAVTIEGRSTTLIALSDFVGNLGAGGVLRRPIDLVNSQVESAPGAGGLDVIRFTVRAQLGGPAAAH